MGRTVCTEPQCLYSRAIPLLPLWAVRPVQSLSACTVELYLYSPYGPYSLYRVSVPVQGCTLPLPFLHQSGRRHYIPSKCRELFTQWRCLTPQETRLLETQPLATLPSNARKHKNWVRQWWQRGRTYSGYELRQITERLVSQASLHPSISPSYCK